MITVTRKIQLKRASDRSQQIRVMPDGASAVVATGPRIPRIARLMALAIHCDEQLRDGKIENQSGLARLLHITQPRLTQIMNLNRLAPDIQEALLFLESTPHGREKVHEKVLRPICSEMNWNVQRKLWSALIHDSQ